MLCTFEPKTRNWNQLDFHSSSEWAESTCAWLRTEVVRKRKLKEKPPKPQRARPRTKLQDPTSKIPKMTIAARPRKPVYLKAVESHSAGPIGRLLNNKSFLNPLDANRETVKCKVVNFTGLGKKLCIKSQSDMRAQSVPNVNDQWDCEESILRKGNGMTVTSTINLDSGHKQCELILPTSFCTFI